MAVLRESANLENTANYIATVALFCGISCTILMLKFLTGFKASLNFASGKWSSNDEREDAPEVAIAGAYRVNKEEFIGNGNVSENQSREKILPSMVKLPPSTQPPAIKSSKSTSNLTQPNATPASISKSTPDVSTDPRGGQVGDRKSTDNRNSGRNQPKTPDKNQKKLDKKELADQKKREADRKKREADEKKRETEQKKTAAQEQAKQEKLRKEKEKIESQRRALEAKQKDKAKKNAPPVPQPRANPLAQGNPMAQMQAQRTNTLESSISRSSGPPPYSEVPNPPRPPPLPSLNDSSGNVSFAKPATNAPTSWDMVSQHRQQISRPPTAGGSKPKQTVMDLNYNTGRPLEASSGGRDNSEA